MQQIFETSAYSNRWTVFIGQWDTLACRWNDWIRNKFRNENHKSAWQRRESYQMQEDTELLSFEGSLRNEFESNTFRSAKSNHTSMSWAYRTLGSCKLLCRWNDDISELTAMNMFDPMHEACRSGEEKKRYNSHHREKGYEVEHGCRWLENWSWNSTRNTFMTEKN